MTRGNSRYVKSEQTDSADNRAELEQLYDHARRAADPRARATIVERIYELENPKIDPDRLRS